MSDDTQKRPPSTRSTPFDFNAGEKAHDIIMSALDEIDAPATIDAEKKREMLSIVEGKDYSPADKPASSEDEESTSERKSSSRGPLYDLKLKSPAAEPERTTKISDTTAQRVPKSDPSHARNNKYKELCRKPSMNKMEANDLVIMEELSDVVAPVNKAVTLLEDFNRRYPEWINEPKFQSYRNCLRETATIMLSEFYSLRNGQKEKTYSEDKVCQQCHSVFMFPLPDNLCDECRSRKTNRNAYDSLEE